MTQGWTTKPRVAGCTSASAADCGMNWRKYGSSCVAARTPRLLKSATPSCTRCAEQIDNFSGPGNNPATGVWMRWAPDAGRGLTFRRLCSMIPLGSLQADLSCKIRRIRQRMLGMQLLSKCSERAHLSDLLRLAVQRQALVDVRRHNCDGGRAV